MSVVCPVYSGNGMMLMSLFCPVHSGKSLRHGEPVYQAIWVENDSFDEVLISPVMIQDHMPDKVLQALQKVGSESSHRPGPGGWSLVRMLGQLLACLCVLLHSTI